MDYPIIVYRQLFSESTLEKLMSFVVILQDDVMITMRVSKFFLENLYTGFNLSDLSQPSTSYLLPIILSPLFFLPDNVALIIVSSLSVIVIIMITFILLNGFQKSSSLRYLLITIFLTNQTTLAFASSGWEIIFQTLFILLVWKLTLDSSESIKLINYLLIGLLASIGFLIRSDSIFLLSGAALYILTSKRIKFILASAIAFLSPTMIYFYFQMSWFGNVFPTTARLKANYLIDFGYMFRYQISLIFSNSAALWVLVTMIIGIVLLLMRRLDYKVSLILLSIFLSFTYNFVVSDVFPYGRMYLPTLAISILFIGHSLDRSLEHKNLNKSGYSFIRIFTYIYLIFSLIINLRFFATDFLLTRIESLEKPVNLHPTIEQYYLSRYISENIPQNDGAIGVMWLGTTGFYLIDYEIADFLGKADELIAITEVRSGPPGHNKWNTQLSFEKWNPAIVFSDIGTYNKIIADGCPIDFDYDWAFSDDILCSALNRGYIIHRPYDQFNQILLVRDDVYKQRIKFN